MPAVPPMRVEKPADAIAAIAKHFTGPMVAHHSIGLELGHIHGKMARLFFDTREQIGITDYMSEADAITRLTKLLTDPLPSNRE